MQASGRRALSCPLCAKDIEQSERSALAAYPSNPVVPPALPACPARRYLPNLVLKPLPLSEAQQQAYEKTGFLRELVFKTAPSVSKVGAAH